MPHAASLGWLILGGLLNLFVGGRWPIPLAAWLAPVFLLHATRVEGVLVGLAWLWLVLFVSTAVAYRGLIPAHGVFSVLVNASIAFSSLLPFLADRLIAPELPGFIGTLAFPLSWAALDFAAGRGNPYGTWGSLAYTQSRNLPFMQLASVTGTVGLSFVVAWFGSVVNWAWDLGFDWNATSAGLGIYGGVWCLVMAFGGARLAFGKKAPSAVRTAAINWPEGLVTPREFMRALEPQLPGQELESLKKTFRRVQEHFLEATRREARAGARIAVWPEANAMMFAEEEAEFIERLRQLAHEERMHVLAGLAVVHRGADRPLENKAVLVDPSGEVAFDYVKAIPVPGFEASISRRGQRQIQTSASEHGRIAAAICFDLDFPGYMRQVGRAGADVLLVPASDWEAIKLAHHESAVFRAIENGVSLVRATRWGLSAAVDPYGHELAIADPFVAPDQAMTAQVPRARVRTIYARYGDWFGWLTVAGLVSLVGWWLVVGGWWLVVGGWWPEP